MTHETPISHSTYLPDIIQLLKYSLNSLDILGFAIAAIHVHTAIETLEVESGASKMPTVLNPTGCAEFVQLDSMAERLFA